MTHTIFLLTRKGNKPLAAATSPESAIHKLETFVGSLNDAAENDLISQVNAIPDNEFREIWRNGRQIFRVHKMNHYTLKKRE